MYFSFALAVYLSLSFSVPQFKNVFFENMWMSSHLSPPATQVAEQANVCYKHS